MVQNIPIVVGGESLEMKCQVASTGSILDFVGDRVHGCDRSSSLLTRFGVTRIGLGAIIGLSWLVAVEGVLDNSGGVLSRGTPEGLANWKEKWLNPEPKNKK